MWKTLKSSYCGVWTIIGRYWRAYGGFRAFLVSPYLHFALLLTLAMSDFWSKQSWWESALSTLPNLLGFTLAGFTIWLGFGDEKFQKLVSTPSKNGAASAYIAVSSGFVHFVLAQLLALILGILAKATDFVLPLDHLLAPYISYLALVGHFIGFFAFMYALLTIMAVTLAVFRTASWNEGLRHRQAKRPIRFQIIQKRKP